MYLLTVCSIRPMDRTLSGATTPGQSGLGSNGNEEVLHIPQISKAVALPSDGLMSYPCGVEWVRVRVRDAVGLLFSPSKMGWNDLLNFG